jgi:hypothetical protein
LFRNAEQRLSSEKCCINCVRFFLRRTGTLSVFRIAALGRYTRLETVTCRHTGLGSSLKDCGTRPDWYSYVFLGSIAAITSVKDDENELKIIPEEVFGGKPAPLLTVLTSQAACLPKLTVGDRWLFFLRDEPGKPIVLDYYGNDSLPAASAQQQIETLRRLKAIADSGLLQGTVLRLTSSGGEAVIGATVIARRLSDGQPYVAKTGTDGRYDFQPLPPDTYKITVEPVGSFRPDDSQVDLPRGSCWDVTLSSSPHAQVSGHVRRSDGSPGEGNHHPCGRRQLQFPYGADR